jgi:hypothetical protein
MGDLEKRVDELLATLREVVPWIDPLAKGKISADDISLNTLLGGVAEALMTFNTGVKLVAREVDLLSDDVRGTHDFGE